jgi:pimeloyl-ACP methyl ester carboxylesterase
VVDVPPAALILVSPFTSLSDMGRLHDPLLPTGPLLRDRYDSMARIGRVSAPVLIIAGERDQVVPPDQSRRLHAAIQRPGAGLVLIPEADHNDFELLAGDQLVDEILGFMDAARLNSS